MVTQRIRKVHTTKLSPGETDPGAADGVTELRAVRTIGPLASGRTWKRRVYADATELPDPVGWLPAAEESAMLWLDPTDTSAPSITASGNNLTQLWDKSGNDYHFTPGASAPQTGTRTINGLNVIDFDGVDDYIQNAGIVFPDSFQIIIAAIPDAVTTGGGNYIVRAGGTSRAVLRSGSNDNFANYFEMFGASNLSDFCGSPTTGGAHIYRMVFDFAANLWSLYIDGALARTQAAGYITAVTDELTVFFAAASGEGFLNGALAGAQMFSDISNTVGQKSEGQLAHLLNITLDAGHPYFESAP